MSKEVIRSGQFCSVKSFVTEEELPTLSPEQLNELKEIYDDTFELYKPGKLTKGTIVSVDSDGIVVDINYKSRGLIPKYEFTDHELKTLTPGQEIEVILDELESPEGTIVLSYEKAKTMRAWDAIMKLYEENKPVEGIVSHKVKGGLSVDIGVPAFLPGSQIDLHRITDFDQFVGQNITAYILKINQKRGNIIISRRKYLNDQRSDARKKILSTLQENQIIQGTVKNITNYGAFIDIGGVDGLLHITDMTWGRISHPSELVRIGDTITVKVLSFDHDNEKISLGLKQLNDNPWSNIDKTLKVGDKIKGRISSITDYGLFVEVAKGIEGLVHISEVSWTDRINNLASKFNVGDEIEVLVVSLDKDNRRMSLSLKQLAENPWDIVEKQFKVGQKIKGTISNITDFGIFVQLMPGIDGLVHISDLSWTEHIEHPSHHYSIGQETETVVLSIDKENKKISLGIKQLTQDPWEQVDQQYPPGSLVEGEVTKITNFGAFVKLPIGIEGLIHSTTMGDKKIEDVLKVGQHVQLRVTHVSKTERKIGLSLNLTSEKDEKISEEIPRKKHQARQTTTRKEKNDSSASKPKGSLQIALESALKEHEESENKDKK